MDVAALNIDLARTLGVNDVSRVHSITLSIKAGKLPTVTIERHCDFADADQVMTAIQVLRLKPEEGDDERSV